MCTFRRAILLIVVSVLAIATQVPLATSSNHHICSDGDVRLFQLPDSRTNSSSMMTGRSLSLVQVCMSECWWYLDEAYWSNTSAAIACNTLGFHHGNNNTDIRIGSVAISLTSMVAIAQIKCRGDELDLSECVMKIKHTPVNHSIIEENNGGSGNGTDHDIDAGSGGGEDHIAAGVNGLSRDTADHHGNDHHSADDTDRINDDSGSGGSGDYQRADDSDSTPTPQVVNNDGSIMIARKGFRAVPKMVTTNIGTLSCQAEAPRVPQPECIEEDIELIPPAQGTSSSMSGVVRICYNGKWSVLCSTSAYWTDKEAGVVCKQLGYAGQDALAVRGGSLPADNTDVILSSRISCGSGYYFKPSLSSCDKYSSCKRVRNCPAGKQLVSVQCEELCQDGDVKYTTAIDHSNFHVVTAMLCEDSVWRPVCDNDWNYRDATVLCRGSGHSEYGALPAQFPLLYARAYELVEVYPSVSMSIDCEGDEQQLSMCRNQSSSLSCLRGGVTAAVCLAAEGYDRINCSTGSAKLLDNGGSVSGSGELQVCINNMWGRVGFYSMTEATAIVICRQLGFNTTDPTIISSDLRIEPLFVPSFACSGQEDHLSECLQFPEPSILLEDEFHDGTKLICANPPTIVSLTPPHIEIRLDNTSQNARQIDFTCTVSGDLPITVEWYFQYYNSSTPKAVPIKWIDYGSIVTTTEGIKQSLNDIRIQEMEMISSEVLTNNHQSRITVNELQPSKNGHYICIASNAYGKDQRHGFLFIRAKPSVHLGLNPLTGIRGDNMTLTCSSMSYYHSLSLNILKDNELITSERLKCSNNSAVTESLNLHMYRLECFIENTTIIDEGIYSCRVSLDSFMAYSNHYYYQVQSFPKIHYLTPNATYNLTNQDTITLNCSISGGPRPFIQWYRLDKGSPCDNNTAPRHILIEPSRLYNISHTNTDSYVTSLLRVYASGNSSDTYVCNGVNTLGTVSKSTTININVIQVEHLHLSVSINTGNNRGVLPGDRVYLTCLVTSSSNLSTPLNIDWIKDGRRITSHMISSHMTKTWNDTLMLSNVNLNDTGMYSCSIIPNSGLSQPIQLNVEEPLMVRLFNNSPQVSTGDMVSYIYVNKPEASCMGTITNMDNTVMNCSSGVVHFTDVWCKGPGKMIDFIVTAETDREVVTIRRQFYPEFNSYCAVNLINEGITIAGLNVTVEFTGIGHSSGFQCHIQDNIWEHCSSPWTASVPRPGIYQLAIKPMGRDCHRDKIVFKQTITVD